MHKLYDITSLTAIEITLYATLLQQPGLNISDLAKAAGLERIACYRTVLKLAGLNLVFCANQDRRRIWFARPKKYFLSQLKRKFTQVKRIVNDITSPAGKTTLKFDYLRSKEIVDLIKEFIKESKNGEIICAVNPKALLAFMDQQDYWKLFKLRKKQRGLVRAIMSKIEDIPGFKPDEDWEKLRIIKLADHEKFPITAFFEVSKNRLLIIPETKSASEAIVIENKEVATTFKSLFELAYRGLKTY